MDCNQRCIKDPLTNFKTSNLSISTIQPEQMFIKLQLPIDTPSSIKELTNNHKDIFGLSSTNLAVINNSPPVQHDTVHRIDTGSSQPTHARARQLHPEKLKHAQTEFRRLLDTGVIRPSSSSWASPLHMVRKQKDGQPTSEWRPCGDYRALNRITKPDSYPLPHIQCFTRSLHGSKVFSKLDLAKAFHQIPVAPEDVPKTAIITPFGLFEYLRMPFGLRNAAQSFQRFIDTVLRDLDFALAYIDDILIFSDSQEAHLHHLEVLFRRLQQYGLRLQPGKCEFMKPELQFLGHLVTPEGIRPSPTKLDVITDWPKPVNVKELRSLLGFLNFYRRFVPHYADIIGPLQDLLTTSLRSSCNFIWKQQHSNTLEAIKSALTSNLLLHHPDPDCTSYQLVTDASSHAIGAALHQMTADGPVPIGMFSRKLTTTQQRYSTFDRELLAAYLSALHFRNLITGRNVTLFTDHKPLSHAFNSSRPLKSDRNQRYLGIVTEHITNIQFISGAENVVADALSRLPTSPTTADTDVDHGIQAAQPPMPAIDLPAIAAAQHLEELSSTEPNFKYYSIDNNNQLLCETSEPYPRPVIPQSLQQPVIKHFHHLGHFGFRKTSRFIMDRYYWSTMRLDIKNFCHTCEICQKVKIGRHTKSAPQSFSLPSNRFETVHIDIVGPLPPTSQLDDVYHPPARYLLTIIDRCTGWLEATPLVNTTAPDVAHAFIQTWVARFGVPLYVVTDRGPQFESEFFYHVSQSVGFHRLRTTAYHPQANGKVERQHRIIKTILKAYNNNWIKDLPLALLALHSAPDENGISPFTLLTGEHLMIPRILTNKDIQPSEIKTTIDDLLHSTLPKKSHATQNSYIPKDLKSATHVWLRVDRVRRPLEAPYTGPFKVISQCPKYFTIELANGSPQTVSIDRLKPCRTRPVTAAPSTNKTATTRTTSMTLPATVTSPDTLPTIPVTTRSGRRVRISQQPDYIYNY